MPKAVRPPTTPRPSAKPAALAGPSILDLARQIQSMDDAMDRLDASRGSRAEYLVNAAIDLAGDRRDALSDLVATMPAQIIGDAAAQLCVAYSVIRYLDGYEMEPTDRATAIRKLRRLILSAAVPVSRTAGLDLAMIGGDEIQADRDTMFLGMGSLT